MCLVFLNVPRPKMIGFLAGSKRINLNFYVNPYGHNLLVALSKTLIFNGMNRMIMHTQIFMQPRNYLVCLKLAERTL